VLINVAFFTLFERKILGLAQFRKGPNKVSFFGILQPIADAVKLFLKELNKPNQRNLVFFVTPVLGISLVILIWNFCPIRASHHEIEFSGLFILVIIRLSLYPLLFSGWASNRKYALIGALRGVAQTISYEISLAIIIFNFFALRGDFSLIKTVIFTSTAYYVVGFGLTAYIIWVIRCVAETNRTPFDFAEGESELVSGFNTEYRGGLFALLFMAEYGRIIFFSYFTCQIIRGDSLIFSSFGAVLLCFVWVWTRAVLPRFRYDMLIRMAWKILLPLSLGVRAIAISCNVFISLI